MKKIIRYIFLAICISSIIYFLFEYPPGTKRLIVVHSEISIDNPLGYSTSNVRKSDYRISDIWNKGETFVLNESGRNIFLEEVYYSTRSSSVKTEPTVITIPPSNKYKALKPSIITYIFITPPRTKSSSGSVDFSWWIHY